MTPHAYLTLFAKTALDAVIATDEQGKIILFDEAAEAIFGHSSKETVGSSVGDVIIPQRYREAHEAGMHRYLNTGVKKLVGGRVEIEGLRADGSEFPLELGLSEITLDGQTIILAFVRDLTERNRVKDELAEAQIRADEANEAKSKFIAMLAHDIRTPMGGIIGSLSLINTAGIDEDSAELVETARRSSKHLTDLLEECLDFSQIEAGEFKILPKATSIAKLVTHMDEVWRHLIEDKGLEFIVEVGADIPEGVYVDPVRLRQILNNLLSNASKYTDTGSVGIRASYDADDEHLKVCVWDTGSGFSAEARETMLQPFSRPGHKYQQGHGVGLAITATLIERMDSEISIADRDTGGTKIEISIPAAVIAKSETESEVDLGNGIRHSFAGQSVLLVEDNPTNVFIAERMLKTIGFEVTTALDGISGLETAKGKHFDLILMDIDLPGMNGVDAIRAIRASGTPSATTHILALTAYVTRDYRKSILDAGSDGIIPKPIEGIGQLSQVIGEVLPGTLQQSVAAETALKKFDATADDLLDPSVLKSLKDVFGPEDMMDLCQQLEIDLTQYISDIEGDSEPWNFEIAQRATHLLTSVAGTMGASKLENDAELLNACCHAAIKEDFPGLRNAVIASGNATLERFSDIKGGLTDGQ